MDTKYYDIVNGPGRDALFDACKYAYSKESDVKVDFTVAAGYTASVGSPYAAYKPMSVGDVVICGITHEDGSGRKFILDGYCSANVESSIYKTHRFVAYYDTKKRSGKINFTT